MSPSVRLDLLGGLSLECADARTGAVQRKRLALLAVVARAGARGVSRERLLALLWPDQAPEDARRALVVALSALRRALPEGALVSLPLGIALDPTWVVIDVVEFESTLARGNRAEAVALYRGPFLDGVTLPGAPEFDRWVEEERAVLARRHVDALAVLAAAARDSGNPASAIRWAQAWAAADPLGARPAVALVEALAAAGDRSGAARAAHAHETLVREQLQILPDPSVARALARVSEAAPGRSPAPAPATVAPLAAPLPDAGMAAETAVEVTTTRAPENAVAPMHIPVAPPRWPAYRSRVASGLIGALAVAVAVGVLSAHRGGHPADTPHRVVVAPFANETGDTALAAIGRIAADWVAQGIGTTGLVQVAPTSSAFAAGRYADSTATRPGAERARLLASETGAGLVVSGGVYRVADSVLLRALIADGRDGHTIRELEPVTAPVDAPIPGIDVLRQRVLGALAPLVDERLVTTAANAGAPPSYQAYREMTEGIRQVVQQDFRTALPRFARAHALDTSYTTALLYAALAQANLGRWAVAESLAARADGSRHRLTPYDAAMLDVIRAWTVSNWPAAYEASVRGARIAPNSMAAVQVGVEAVRLNRPREAARVLEAIDPTRGELRGFSPYHITLADAYHLLGRYEDELRVARRFGASEPANPAAVLAQARALAAHGRSGEALALIDVRLAMAWGDGPPPDAMMLTLARELEAHGHSAAAATVWRRLLAWLDVRDAERRRSPGCRACRGYALAGLDRATESRAVFAALAEEDTSNLLAQRNLGVAAARTADRATAVRAAVRLASATGRAIPDALFWRAQIAAQLGDLAGATELLREALGRGLPFSSALFHASPELAPLRAHAPFRALVSPRG